MPFENYLPSLSIDCVIFGFHENELKVLLLKLKKANVWALPGGFIEKSQDIDMSAASVLKRRAGMDDIYLKQFHIFGKADRIADDHASKMINRGFIPESYRNWFERRFVSIGYYALVEYSKVKKPTPDITSEACKWCPFNDLPSMMIDHRSIIAKAHESLKKELLLYPVGVNLLSKEFTMPELQALYETILDKKLDRRNFRRRMLGYDLLINTGKRRRGGAHKAPILYRFDQDKYEIAMEEGLRGGW